MVDGFGEDTGVTRLSAVSVERMDASVLRLGVRAPKLPRSGVRSVGLGGCEGLVSAGGRVYCDAGSVTSALQTGHCIVCANM